MAHILTGRKWSEVVRGILLAILVMSMSYGVIYLVNQQQLRQSGNDPQIQMVEDYANQLGMGSSLSIFNDTKLVDIDKSLSPYVMVYDNSGKMMFSSARLSGNIPNLPSGVLDYTRTHQDDIVTWQPRVGVRQATVVKYFKGVDSGFVVAGRSLREVELREDRLVKQMLFIWILSVIIISAVEILTGNLWRRKQ